MPSKTSSFNRGIWKQNVRNVGWIGLVYFLGLTFALPLQLLMVYSNKERAYYYEAKGLFNVMGEFQILLVFVLPVLLAVFLFRYMQVKLSTDFIHSLPIRRETLYHQQALLGSLLLIVPVILTGMILWLLHGALDLSDLYSKSEIGHWMIVTCLWNLFVFFAGVFVAVFTGMSVLQGALTYILLFLPAGLIILTFMNAKYFLFGFSVNYYLNQQVEWLIPYVRAFEMTRHPLTGTEWIVYGLLIVIFYTLSLIVYKKRQIEAATQAIAFRPLQPVFKYGVTFCAMLVGGLYFGETQNDFGWILFGFAAASLIGYFVAGMILQKTWRVFGQWKGYLIFALTMFIAGILLQMDITGYEKKQPDLADINRVYFAESIYPLTDAYQKQREAEMEDSSQVYITDEEEYYFKDPKNIEHIYELHQQIIKERPARVHPRDTRSVAIGYELNNGKRIVRYYDIPFESYKPLYKPIVESNEYKENRYSLLRESKKNDVIDKITIQPDGPMGKRAVITDPERIKEFTAIVKEELKSETSEQIFDDSSSWAYIEFLYSNNKQMNVPWKKSYKKIEEWLKENKLLEQARVMPADLAYAVVIKNEEGKDRYEYIRSDEIEKKFKDREDGLRIKDKKQLEQVLLAAKQQELGTYVIAFYFIGNPYPEFQVFDEKSAPDFVKQHFAQ